VNVVRRKGINMTYNILVWQARLPPHVVQLLGLCTCCNGDTAEYVDGVLRGKGMQILSDSRSLSVLVVMLS